VAGSRDPVVEYTLVTNTADKARTAISCSDELITARSTRT